MMKLTEELRIVQQDAPDSLILAKILSVIEANTMKQGDLRDALMKLTEALGTEEGFFWAWQ
jgi:hypothetical protein